jgi:hypothetical protein
MGLSNLNIIGIDFLAWLFYKIWKAAPVSEQPFVFPVIGSKFSVVSNPVELFLNCLKNWNPTSLLEPEKPPNPPQALPSCLKIFEQEAANAVIQVHHP